MYEQMRMFERKCLRVCFEMYRSVHSEYQHRISNKIIYNGANIPRIDSSALELTRDYFSNLPRIGNSIIDSITDQNAAESERQIQIGYPSPQAFEYWDEKWLIQNANNIPVIFHWKRNKAYKRMSLHSTDFRNNPEKFSGLTSLPQCDSYDFHRLKFDKYEWLNADSTHLRELQERKSLLARSQRRRLRQ